MHARVYNIIAVLEISQLTLDDEFCLTGSDCLNAIRHDTTVSGLVALCDIRNHQPSCGGASDAGTVCRVYTVSQVSTIPLPLILRVGATDDVYTKSSTLSHG